MKQVWVVARGQYSDYEVIAVVESRQLADRLAEGALGWVGRESHGRDESPVPLFEEGDELPTTYTVWSARADANGVRESEVYEHHRSTFDEPSDWFRTPRWAHGTVTVGEYPTADEARAAALAAYEQGPST